MNLQPQFRTRVERTSALNTAQLRPRVHVFHSLSDSTKPFNCPWTHYDNHFATFCNVTVIPVCELFQPALNLFCSGREYGRYATGCSCKVTLTALAGQFVQSVYRSLLLQVPFMRNWFKDQCTTQFTIALFFKRDGANGGQVGLVNNGDCVDPPTYLINGDEGSDGQCVVGGLDTDGNPLTLTDSVPVSANSYVAYCVSFTGSRGEWE